MPQEQYDPSALAIPVDDHSSPNQSERPSSPFWSRPRSFRPQSNMNTTSPRQKQSLVQRLKSTALDYFHYGLTTYRGLTYTQKCILYGLIVLNIVFGTLFLVYNEDIFKFLVGVAKSWKAITGGWVILWVLTFVVAMPPLIGYSTLLSLAGFVYGFPNAWPIVASANILGSATSFLICRRYFSGYTQRLVQKDPRFAALALTIKHDGLKLLCMIRFAPLPYSLSNGAIATIPTVTFTQFVLATTLVSPKLLIHIFVSSRLADLAEHGGEMDFKTKMVSYISIGLGSLVGLVTGYVIWRQTTKRAAELEAEEIETGLQRTTSGGSGSQRLRREYSDDAADREAAGLIRDEDDDAISLRDPDEWAYDFEEEDEQEGKSREGRRSGDGLKVEAGEGYRDRSPHS